MLFLSFSFHIPIVSCFVTVAVLKSIVVGPSHSFTVSELVKSWLVPKPWEQKVPFLVNFLLLHLLQLTFGSHGLGIERDGDVRVCLWMSTQKHLSFKNPSLSPFLQTIFGSFFSLWPFKNHVVKVLGDFNSYMQT